MELSSWKWEPVLFLFLHGFFKSLGCWTILFCASYQDFAGRAHSRHCWHACLLLLSWTATGRKKKGTYSFMSLKLPFGILGEIAFDGTGWAYGFQCYSYFFAIFMCFGSSRIHDSCYNGYDKSNLLTYFCSCYKWFCCQIANKVLVFFFHNGSSFFF